MPSLRMDITVVLRQDILGLEEMERKERLCRDLAELSPGDGRIFVLAVSLDGQSQFESHRVACGRIFQTLQLFLGEDAVSRDYAIIQDEAQE